MNAQTNEQLIKQKQLRQNKKENKRTPMKFETLKSK